MCEAQVTVLTEAQEQLVVQCWGGCVGAWKLGEEERGLLVLNRDAVVAFFMCLASDCFLRWAPGTQRHYWNSSGF